MDMCRSWSGWSVSPLVEMEEELHLGAKQNLDVCGALVLFSPNSKKLTRFPPSLSSKHTQPRPPKLPRRSPLHALQRLWCSTWPASQDQQSDPDRHRCVYGCVWDFDGRLFAVARWEGEEEA